MFSDMSIKQNPDTVVWVELILSNSQVRGAIISIHQGSHLASAHPLPVSWYALDTECYWVDSMRQRVGGTNG